MKQTGVLDNACGIIACLHSVLNNLDKITLEKDSVLGQFWEKAKDISPAERATLLENFTAFQEIHKKHASEGGSHMPSSQSEVKHHFIAFTVNKSGQLIELDGTKQGPLVVMEKSEDVLKDSAAELMKRLAAGEISESLSALILCSSQD